MKAVTIICEYNPFHKGHAKQLAALRDLFAAREEETVLLAVMSGNYVQRGQPALFDKYTRAKAALLCGADLVAELPYPYSASPADRFAAAGVYLSKMLGADHLAFGSESLRPGEEEAYLRWLRQVAAFRDATGENDCTHSPLSSAERKRQRFEEETGLPYPAAPNDRLAAEYLRSVQRLAKGEISLLPLQRARDGFSAHRVRVLFEEGAAQAAQALVPEDVRFLYDGREPASLQRGMPLLLAALRMKSREELALLFDIPKEMAARLKSAGDEADALSFPAFFEKLQNKNDSSARLRRALLTALFSVKPEDLVPPPSYLLLLGAGEKGRDYLRALAKKKTGAKEPFPLVRTLGEADSLIYTQKDVTASQREKMRRQLQLHLQGELLYGFFSGRVRSKKEILAAKPVILGTGQ